MTPEVIIDIFRTGLYFIVLLVLVLVVPGLVMGLLVSMFQAATQINEMSMTFVPKFMITVGALVTFGPWLLNLLTSYTIEFYQRIPSLIG